LPLGSVTVASFAGIPAKQVGGVANLRVR
jgi:hypothetical protein